MMTITCKLTFKDGAVVTARIEAESPDREYPIKYTGPVTRLAKWSLSDADAGFLEFIFKRMAVETGAVLDVLREGEFDRFAE
jgi:hypothetical protein